MLYCIVLYCIMLYCIGLFYLQHSYPTLQSPPHHLHPPLFSSNWDNPWLLSSLFYSLSLASSHLLTHCLIKIPELTGRHVNGSQWFQESGSLYARSNQHSYTGLTIYRQNIEIIWTVFCCVVLCYVLLNKIVLYWIVSYSIAVHCILFHRVLHCIISSFIVLQCN